MSDSILDTVLANGIAPPAGAVITADFSGARASGQTDVTASRQWLSRPDDQRYTSVDALLAACQDRRDRSADVVATLRDMRASYETSGLQVHAAASVKGGNELAPSNHAFSQLCASVGAPASYLRQLPGRLAADCLDHGLRAVATDEKVQLMSAGRELRAVTGPNYGRIWDADVVAAVKQVTEAGNGRWQVPQAFRTASNMAAHPVIDVTTEDTTLYASDRDVFLFLVDQQNPIECGKLANGSPDLYFRGFYGWNGECGGVSNGFGTFLYRYVCCNRMIWGQRGFQSIRIKHTSGAPTRFVSQMIPALQAFVDGSATGIETGLIAAKRTILARNDEKRHSILDMFDFGPREQTAILARIIAEEGKPAESAWDFIQGITSYARTVPNQDARIKVEQAGKVLLDRVLAAA